MTFISQNLKMFREKGDTWIFSGTKIVIDIISFFVKRINGKVYTDYMKCSKLVIIGILHSEEALHLKLLSVLCNPLF